MKQDVYKKVTDTILAALEAGTRPWMQPWHAAHAAGPISRPLRHNGKPYSGINTLMLWGTAMEKGYVAPIWMTYQQAQELGAQVKKGEHGSLVVYANTLTRTETNEKTGQDEEIEIPYMKGYTVFNVEQIDGLPAHYTAKAAPPILSESERHARLDAFFVATGADIRHGGNQAFYTLTHDFIKMPPFEFFRDREGYYATLAHETTHWTRHPSRLNRDMGRKKWGDAGYAMEELVAEIGSAFLCAELGLTPEIRDDHAAYIASWLKVLKDDKKAIFTAARHAQKAADYLLNLQPQPDPEPDPEQQPETDPPAPAPESEPERAPAIGPAPAAVAEDSAEIPPDRGGIAQSSPPPTGAQKPERPNGGRIEGGSVLSFPDRGPWGKATYRGNCSGHVYRRLFEVLRPQVFTDPTVGSGTSVEVARSMGIEAHGLDLHSGFNLIGQRILEAVGKPSDLVLSHPPYHNLIVYSGQVWGTEPHPDDLSRCETEEDFMDKLVLAMKNQRNATAPGGYYGTIIGDVRKNGQYSSYQADLIARCPKSELRAVLIKEQFNVSSHQKAYPLSLPRIMHEYVLLWQKPYTITVSTPVRSEQSGLLPLSPEPGA